jgi:hypothetical protein
VSFKGAHVVKDIILTCVQWYLAYPLSYRQVEELMEERGVELDHATIHRWVLKYSSQLEEKFHPRKRPVGRRWRMDETYIRDDILSASCGERQRYTRGDRFRPPRWLSHSKTATGDRR